MMLLFPESLARVDALIFFPIMYAHHILHFHLFMLLGKVRTLLKNHIRKQWICK